MSDLGILLPLFVAIPLAASAICVIIPWKPLRDVLHIAVPFAGMIGAGYFFVYTSQHGTLGHSIGLYPGGVAIPFAVDAFSAIMLLVAMLVATTANWFATAVAETNARFYPALTLMLVSGVCGAMLTADLFNFFVFMEVMLLPSYGLVAMTGTWSRLVAGRSFVLVNLLASTILLIGAAMVYGVAGSVNIAILDGAARGNGPLTVAMGLVMLALVVKAGVFPVHTWLPRTYPGSSAAVMGLFSALHTKVAVYMIFRLYVMVFDLDQRWHGLMIAVLLISMILGSYAGLAENTIRRVLAYQMVTGMPFILIVLAFTDSGAQRALAAGLLYALHHMVTLGALILASGAIEETYGTGLISRLRGLMRRDPLVAAVFAAGSFSVIGFPPFSGLWGKVYVVVAVARTGDWKAGLVIACIIFGSFGALLTMLRVWREVFWGSDMNRKRVPTELTVPFKSIAPAVFLILVSAAMFFAGGTVIDATLTASDSLLDHTSYIHAVLGDNPAAAIGSLSAGK